MSLSGDGVSLPRLFLELGIINGLNEPKVGSKVVRINDEDAHEALEALSKGTNYYDADARYNNVFANPVVRAFGKSRSNDLFSRSEPISHPRFKWKPWSQSDALHLRWRNHELHRREQDRGDRR